MTYKIILTDSAFKDLENIKFYIPKDNEVASKKYIRKIFDRIEFLSKFPHLGLKIANSFISYKNIFYLVCLNHIVIYQINEFAKCIYILRVFSHFQNWKNILNKDLLNKEEVITHSSRLLITKMNQSMYYDVYRNSLDEDNKKYVPDEVFESVEEASEVVNEIIKNYDSKDGPFVYAVIRKLDHVNLGYVQLIKISDGWEIGYHIAKIFTKNGYASEALNIFLEYIKENLDINEVLGIALANNKASRRVLEKCGFKLIFENEGIYQGKKRKIIKTIKKLRS